MTRPKFNSPEDLTESDIVQRCADPQRQLVGTTGNVVKISDDVVVKFGCNVTAEEAINQRRAFELLDQRIIRVPMVHRHFTIFGPDQGWPPDTGYIVMEYIEGKVFGEDEGPNSEQVKRIAQILEYFSTITSQSPGPLEGSISRGLMWEKNGKPVFKTVQQLEKWLNFRLSNVEAKLNIAQYPLVLCHLDLAPRNFVWLADGSLCLLDWASAGFYPRFFEVCMLKILERTHGTYERDLMAQMPKLTEDEEAQMKLLRRSFYNGIKYRFDGIHETLV